MKHNRANKCIIKKHDNIYEEKNYKVPRELKGGGGDS